MAAYENELLPMPIFFTERCNLAKKVWDTVFVESKCPEPETCLRIDNRGEFKTLPLTSNEDSFYKSLSLYTFGVEDFSYLMRKAVLKHARCNNDILTQIFGQCKEFSELNCSVYDALKESDRTGEQASYIDVHVAAHLLHIPIVVIRETRWSSLEPVTFTPDGKCCEQVTNAILLATRASHNDEGTLIFSPVVSYRRDMFMDTETSSFFKDIDETLSPRADGNYCVILLNKQKTDYVKIPYTVVIGYSAKLAQFCGNVLETKVSIETLNRVKAYMLNPSRPFGEKLDYELYQFAKNWNIWIILDRIDEYLQESSVSEVIGFLNHNSLNRNSRLYDYVMKSMYNARFDELKGLRVQPVSETHRHLDDYLSKLVVCKENCQRSWLNYTLPEIVLNFDTVSSCLVKYYTGEKWCSLFVPDSIETVIPYLKDNKFCMLGDMLYFIKDSRTLGEVKLINNYKGTISYTRIPAGVSNPRITTTCHKNVLLLLSTETDRMISEVRRRTDEVGYESTVISPWRTIEVEKYDFTFVDKSCILYSIENYRCALKSDTANDENILFGVETDEQFHPTLTHYRIGSNCDTEEDQTVKGKLTNVYVSIPQRSASAGPNLLIDFRVLFAHLCRCY